MTDLETAHQVCTPNELAAYKLRAYGMTQLAIAHALGVSRATVRARIERANTKIERAQRKDAA